MNELDTLIDKYDSIVEKLYNIATNPDTDYDSLLKLYKLGDLYIQSGIIANINTPSRLLEIMLEAFCGVGGADEEIRIHIVWNPSLNIEIVKHIMKDDASPQVREAALTAFIKRATLNPNIDSSELFNLYIAIDETESVSNGKRQAIAKNALLSHPKFPREKATGERGALVDNAFKESK